MTAVRHKQLSHVEIKSPNEGQVSAVFSTFNVLDSDNDVTLPGAFEDGAEVVISGYQHTSWGGALPVGKGRIRTTKSEAIMEGQFFLDTTAGRETFTVVKELGPRQQWSYGFDIEEAEPGTFNGEDVQFLKRLTVFEVSPVLRGAGVNTRTLVAKAALAETALDSEGAEVAAIEFARFTRAELDRQIVTELDPIRVQTELLAIRDGIGSLT